MVDNEVFFYSDLVLNGIVGCGSWFNRHQSYNMRYENVESNTLFASSAHLCPIFFPPFLINQFAVKHDVIVCASPLDVQRGLFWLARCETGTDATL